MTHDARATYGAMKVWIHGVGVVDTGDEAPAFWIRRKLPDKRVMWSPARWSDRLGEYVRGNRTTIQRGNDGRGQV